MTGDSLRQIARRLDSSAAASQKRLLRMSIVRRYRCSFSRVVAFTAMLEFLCCFGYRTQESPSCRALRSRWSLSVRRDVGPPCASSRAQGFQRAVSITPGKLGVVLEMQSRPGMKSRRGELDGNRIPTACSAQERESAMHLRIGVAIGEYPAAVFGDGVRVHVTADRHGL